MATLVVRFGLKPWELARLTDRQIRDLYWHRRDKDGEIEIPDLPEEPKPPKKWTLEEELVQLRVLAGVFAIPAAEVERLEQELRVKYGR